MSQTPAPKSFPLDPQFRTVMSNYLSTRPYNEVTDLIDTLKKDEPVDSKFLQQLANSLIKEVPVRLYVAVQQAINGLQQPQQQQQRAAGTDDAVKRPQPPAGGPGGRPRPRPRQRPEEDTAKPSLNDDENEEETKTESK